MKYNVSRLDRKINQSSRSQRLRKTRKIKKFRITCPSKSLDNCKKGKLLRINYVKHFDNCVVYTVKASVH